MIGGLPGGWSASFTRQIGTRRGDAESRMARASGRFRGAQPHAAIFPADGGTRSLRADGRSVRAQAPLQNQLAKRGRARGRASPSFQRRLPGRGHFRGGHPLQHQQQDGLQWRSGDLRGFGHFCLQCLAAFRGRFRLLGRPLRGRIAAAGGGGLLRGTVRPQRGERTVIRKHQPRGEGQHHECGPPSPVVSKSVQAADPFQWFDGVVKVPLLLPCVTSPGL